MIPEPSDFGAVVRSNRLSRGLTLSEVASKMGYSTVYQSEIERGIKTPTRERVLQLSNMLGLNAGKMEAKIDRKDYVSRSEYENLIRNGAVLAAFAKRHKMHSTQVALFEKLKEVCGE